MLEQGSGFPDERVEADRIARVSLSKTAHELFPIYSLSDQCHDEIIRKCFEKLSPLEDPAISALVFLANFYFIRGQLVDTLKMVNHSSVRAQVRYLEGMDPSSIADRSMRLVSEMEESVENKEPVEKYRRIAEVTQIAKQFYLKRLTVRG